MMKNFSFSKIFVVCLFLALFKRHLKSFLLMGCIMFAPALFAQDFTFLNPVTNPFFPYHKTADPGSRVETFVPEGWLSEATSKDRITLQPVGYKQLKTTTVKSGKLKAVFIDNTDLPPYHNKGYSGIAELYHSNQDSNVFVPSYSGFNLEHIFNGESPDPLFEPRRNPVYLYQKSETEVLLYQKSTPVSSAESLIEFKLVAPYYIDFTFHCVLHDKKYFQHDYVGFFFADYINKPFDRNIYFQGIADNHSNQSGGRLVSAYSEKHGYKSTHRAINDKYDFYFAPDFTITLANHFSDYRYTKSFFFGSFQNMAFAYFFEPSGLIRFSQSPDGAGIGNPAWDFYYTIPQPETEREYTFKGRIVYKPFTTAKDINREYKKWMRKR